PCRETGPGAFPDQEQPQDQRDGARQDVRVERPGIEAREVGLSTPQEVGRKIGWDVVVIIADHTGRHLDDHQARQEGRGPPGGREGPGASRESSSVDVPSDRAAPPPWYRPGASPTPACPAPVLPGNGLPSDHENPSSWHAKCLHLSWPTPGRSWACGT